MNIGRGSLGDSAAFFYGVIEMEIQELATELRETHDRMAAIHSAAEADIRELTDEENLQHDNLEVEFERKNKRIQQLRKLDEQEASLEQSLGRTSQPVEAELLTDAQPRMSAGTSLAIPGDDGPQRINARVISDFDRRTHGFRHGGEFLQSVAMAARPHQRKTDPRLYFNDPTTVSSTTDADGGFSIPPDFRIGIDQLVKSENSLLGLTNPTQTQFNTITKPKSEVTPWGTTGAQAVWGAEGIIKTQSKVALLQNIISLHKLYVLMPVTDELLEDAPGLNMHIMETAPAAIDYEVSDAIVRGDGSTQPLGFVGHAATVVVAKETGQAIGSVMFENIVKMWGRLTSWSRSGAVWLVNQEVEANLAMMAFDSDATSKVPVYLPQNSLAGSPWATLYGRPVIPHQVMSAAGNVGDIVLCNLDQGYYSATKVGGVQFATSFHVYFDFDVSAFRWVGRFAGEPRFDAAVASAQDATFTMSPIVALADRLV